jgi:hypothetical protein
MSRSARSSDDNPGLIHILTLEWDAPDDTPTTAQTLAQGM